MQRWSRKIGRKWYVRTLQLWRAVAAFLAVVFFQKRLPGKWRTTRGPNPIARGEGSGFEPVRVRNYHAHTISSCGIAGDSPIDNGALISSANDNRTFALGCLLWFGACPTMTGAEVAPAFLGQALTL
jgi:hypothetical protein